MDFRNPAGSARRAHHSPGGPAVDFRNPAGSARRAHHVSGGPAVDFRNLGGFVLLACHAWHRRSGALRWWLTNRRGRRIPVILVRRSPMRASRSSLRAS